MEELKFKRIMFDEGYYANIIPSASDPNTYEMWMHKSDSGNALFMFGVSAEDFENNRENLIAEMTSYVGYYKVVYE